MIVLDTNLLIYAHRSKTEEHKQAKAAIEEACRDVRGFGTVIPCIAEFWSVVTHVEASGRPSTPNETAEYLRALKKAGMAVWGPHEGFEERLCQLAQDLKVRGARIFDLQIALIAFENGATEIWTHDKDFVRIPGLKFVDPLKVPSR